MPDLDESTAENSEFVARGLHFLSINYVQLIVFEGRERICTQIAAIARCRWPNAPEELVERVVDHLCDDEALRIVAEQLGLAHVVRTAEFPPSTSTLIDALFALVGVLKDAHRVHTFICDFILPPIVDLPFEDLLPFCAPLPLATEYLKLQGFNDIEARILHSSGVHSATPLFVVGIYADEEPYAQGAFSCLRF